MITDYELEVEEDGDSYIVPIPKHWEGVENGRIHIILNDLCIIAPPSVMSAAGEVVVLKFVEAMIDARIVDAGDVQKALEHLV